VLEINDSSFAITLLNIVDIVEVQNGKNGLNGHLFWKGTDNRNFKIIVF
jgi:hypothetical protein